MSACTTWILHARADPAEVHHIVLNLAVKSILEGRTAIQFNTIQL